MAVTFLDAAKFSDYVYKDHVSTMPEGFQKLEVPSEHQYALDFRAEAYINPDTKEVVIAYAGTDGFDDADDDTKLALLQKIAQTDDAKVFLNDVIKTINQDKTSIGFSSKGANFTITGHSLGGYLAQQALKEIFTSSEYQNLIDSQNVFGMVLNAPGINHNEEQYPNAISLRDDFDIVSLAGGDTAAKYTISVNGDSNSILGSHSVVTLIRYLEQHPALAYLTSTLFKELSSNEKEILIRNPDRFILHLKENNPDLYEKMQNDENYLKLDNEYKTQKAYSTLEKFNDGGNLSFHEVFETISKSPDIAKEFKDILEQKGNNDLLDYFNTDGTFKEDIPESVKTRLILETQEGSQLSTQIGSTLGGSIGSIINSNNSFSNIEKIALSAATITLGQNVGEYVYWNKTTDGSTAFDDAGIDFKNNLQGAVVSFAISAFFAKNDNISDILGMDGTFVGNLVDFTASYTLSTVAMNYMNSKDLLYNFNPYNAVGGFLGNYIGNQIAGSWIDTKNEAIGASIGSAIGSTLGVAAAIPGGALASQFAAFGSFAGPIGALVGAVIGVIVGSVLGGLFGGKKQPPPPTADATLEFDDETSTYKLISSHAANGGNEAAIKKIGENFAKQLENMFNLPGGQLVDGSRLPDIHVNQVKDTVTINGQKGSFSDVSQIVADLLTTHIPFINVENGDAYILRALNRTNENLIATNTETMKGRGDLEKLYENVGLAADYSKYKNEQTVLVDKNGNLITDKEALEKINQEYLNIQALTDDKAKEAALKTFLDTYTFMMSSEAQNWSVFNVKKLRIET